MLSGKLVKRYSNVSDLVFFELRTSFLLEIVQPFFCGRSEGRGQLRMQERYCPANKTASLLHKHNGKEQD